MSTLYNPFPPESVAVSRLIAMGFVGRRLGEFDAEPESLVYIRQLKVDIRDLVRVVGPDECEAVRMVGSAVALQTIGAISFAFIIGVVIRDQLKDRWPFVYRFLWTWWRRRPKRR